MSLPVLHDPTLPGLAIVTDPAAFVQALARALADRLPWRLAGARIERIRYRKGERAILQVELVPEQPGVSPLPASIWLHAGTKAAKLARRATGTDGRGSPILEPLSGALVYLFPDDPHVREIAKFLAAPAAHADLLPHGSTARSNEPELMRFRPGLGATFRWAGNGRGTAFVKIHNGAEAAGAIRRLQLLRLLAIDRCFAVPDPIGIDAGLNAHAMREVVGYGYGDILLREPVTVVEEFTEILLSALADLHQCGLEVEEIKDRDHFLRRAASAAELIAFLAPSAGDEARALASMLARLPAALKPSLAHTDIKVEHVVFSRGKAVLLDLDSLAMADPLYDLAMLDMRVAMHAAVFPRAQRAAQTVHGMIGRMVSDRSEPDGADRLAWLGICAALQLAKHHAQNPRPRSHQLVRTALDLGRQSLRQLTDRPTVPETTRPNHGAYAS